MYAGPLLWNALPQCITCTTTLSSFKSKYKHYLFMQFALLCHKYLPPPLSIVFLLFLSVMSTVSCNVIIM